MSGNPLATQFFRPIESGAPLPPAATAPLDPNDHQVGTSSWWIERLARALVVRNERLGRLRAYYRGENDTWKFANQAHRDTFGVRFHNLRANYAAPVVEIPEQRMTVIGMSLGADEDGSDEAWRIWQANQLDAGSHEAHLEVLSVGECPIIVGPDPDDASTPLITVEDPLQVILETDLANRRKRLAALKLWTEDDGRQVAILYLPDRIGWFRTEDKVEHGKKRTWQPIEGLEQTNRLGVVPVVVLRNAPRARAEHEGILGQLDLYAKTLYDMATTADFMAFPQRYAAGVDSGEEGTEKDEDGNPTSTEAASFAAGPNRVWTSEDPDAKFGQLPAADMQAFVRTLEAYRADMATITHTPERLLLPRAQSVPPSGESVRLSEIGLTRKVRRKLSTVGDGWEAVLRLAFLVKGDAARAARMDMETIWDDPEVWTEAEHVDALSKMAAMGVPREELWRRMRATPQQIRRWAALAPAAPDEMTVAERANTAAILFRSGVTWAEAARIAGLPATGHTGLQSVTVKAPDSGAPAPEGDVTDA